MSIEQLFPGYTHETYRTARCIVECEDGIVRELSPDCPLFKELQARYEKSLKASMEELFDL